MTGANGDLRGGLLVGRDGEQALIATRLADREAGIAILVRGPAGIGLRAGRGDSRPTGRRGGRAAAAGGRGPAVAGSGNGRRSSLYRPAPCPRPGRATGHDPGQRTRPPPRRSCLPARSEAARRRRLASAPGLRRARSQPGEPGHGTTGGRGQPARTGGAAEDRQPDAAGVGESRVAAAHQRLMAAFAARVERLPSAARTALILLALDDSGSVAELLDALGTAGAAAQLDVLEPAIAAGLVQLGVRAQRRG